MTSLLTALKRIEAAAACVAPDETAHKTLCNEGLRLTETIVAAALSEPDSLELAPEFSWEPAVPLCTATAVAETVLALPDDPFGPPGRQDDQPYRDLATNILSQLDRDRAAVLLFTGPPGVSGQTFVVARLGAVLADKVEGEVLVVDVNLRRPALAEQFAVQAERGLVDVLLRAVGWQEVVRRTGDEGLSVLPGRRFPTPDARPPERFEPAWLLDHLRRHYRLVLLDAGSLGHEDVAHWLRFCEGTYLVVELGQTTARAARRAVEVIDRAGGLALGCLLTLN